MIDLLIIKIKFSLINIKKYLQFKPKLFINNCWQKLKN